MADEIRQEGKALKNEGNSPKNGQERTRNFAFLVYPDSAPADWRETLSEAHVEALISPLHDKDVNPDGTQKKPHWHVLIMYSGVKSRAQAAKLRDAVGGVGWEEVASTRGYARYLIHADNPEKAQYSAEDVVELGGADYSAITRRAADSTKAVREMLAFIRENDVLFFCDFMDYCSDERPDWFEVLLGGNIYPVYTYLKARAKKGEMLNRDVGRGYRVDLSTGEIVEKGGVRDDRQD